MSKIKGHITPGGGGKEESVYLPPSISALERRPVLSASQTRIYTTMILGKVLTVIDTLVSEDKQNKATKDIIKTLVWDTYQKLFNWTMGESEKTGSPFPFKAEEA